MTSKQLSLLLAVLTVAMSIPLFFTYAIKHTLFPQGYLFVFMYSAGLISVIVVPVLLVIEGALLFVFWQSRNIARWHAVALAVAVLAETVFLIAREI